MGGATSTDQGSAQHESKNSDDQDHMSSTQTSEVHPQISTSDQDHTKAFVRSNALATHTEEENLKREVEGWKQKAQYQAKELSQQKKRYEDEIQRLNSKIHQNIEEQMQEILKQGRFLERLQSETGSSNEVIPQIQPLSQECFERAMESQQKTFIEVMTTLGEQIQRKESDWQNRMVAQSEAFKEHNICRLETVNKDLHQKFKKSSQCTTAECVDVKKRATLLQNELDKKTQQLRKGEEHILSLEKEKHEIEARASALKDKVSRLEADNKNLQKLKKRAEYYDKRRNVSQEESTVDHKDLRKLVQQNEYLRTELNTLKSASECPRRDCMQIKWKITDLEQQLNKKKSQFEKLSVMKQLEKQNATEHDKLNVEYDELWNPDIILEELEKYYDPFDAKCLLTEIFMDTYEQSKKYLMKYLFRHCIDNLYNLCEHMDHEKKAELDGLSRAYGLLLHSSGAKTTETEAMAITHVCEKMKQKPNLEALQKFNIADPPLQHVIGVAWKFVTQACPIIACKPEKYNPEIHRTCFSHWDEKHDDSKPLIYAKPVLYRSYHCVFLNSGHVGNTINQTSVV